MIKRPSWMKSRACRNSSMF